MTAYQVTAPYVTARVAGETGEMMLGFYEGAALPANVIKESAELLVRKGMVKLVKGAPAEPAPKSTEKQSTEQGTVPQGNASRETWAAHATSKGAPVEETQPVEQGGLSRDELRAKYGG